MSHTLVLNADMNPLGLLPVSALSWQDAVRALWLGTVTPLHDYLDWRVHSPSHDYFVPSVVITKTYVKTRRNVAFADSMIYLRDGYQCQYCGKTFPERLLTMDHVHPKSMGGKKSWTNIVAACGPCNNRRGTNTRIRPKNMPQRPSYHEMAERRRQHPLVIPDAAWLPYLNWSNNNINIVPPYGMPGYSPATSRVLRNLVDSEE